MQICLISFILTTKKCDDVFYVEEVTKRKYCALGLDYSNPLELFSSGFVLKTKIQKSFGKNQLTGI